MSAIAIPWLVLSDTGSPAKTGLVAFAHMAPYIAVQALAGPLVDRVGLRRTFVWGNAAAALPVAAVPLAYIAGALTLPVLVLLVAVAGTVRGAADCAHTALVPGTAEMGRIALERAAGLNTGANRAALVLGGSAAGALVAVAGAPAAIAVDAATFAVAAVIAAIWVRVPPVAAAAEPTGSGLRRYARDLGAGLRFIRGDRLLLGIITMVAVTNLLDQGLTEVMLPVWVSDEIGTPSALGVLAAVGGAASVVGNLVGAWLGPRLPRRHLYSIGFLVGGAPRFLVLVVTTTLSPVLVVLVISDGFAGSINSVLGATTYDRIPTHLRTRVLGAVRASAWIGIPVGALVAGFATEAVGLRRALVAAGLVYLVTTLAPFVFPAWREMRRPEPTREPVCSVSTDSDQ
jgi:MFS family permease